jgi:hypothetical protein
MVDGEENMGVVSLDKADNLMANTLISTQPSRHPIQVRLFTS